LLPLVPDDGYTALLRPREIRRIDWILLATSGALSALGIAVLWGIVRWAPEWQSLPVRQTQWLAVSFGVLGVVVWLDYRVWKRWGYVAYAVAVMGLSLLFVLGHTENNATRWFRLGPVSVQPSEFARVAFVLVVAARFANRAPRRWLSDILPAIALMAVPSALILRQPDLGTALLFVPTLFSMLYLAGAPRSKLAALAVAAAASIPLVWFQMGDAQRGRILGFLWPERDPFGTGWHVTRSVAATISGGVTGNGFSSGSPILLHRGFKAFNDFIFAAISHELGFVGAMATLLLFLVFFSRGAEIASRARDGYGRLVASGLLTMLGVQTLINLGMTIRLCPITGMTLPFVSQGGSSLVSCYVMAGLIVNVGMRQHPRLAPENALETC